MFMISYDFTSFFTNIPLSETVDLAVNAIFESNTGLDLKLNKIKLRELFYFATSHTHFLFNGSFYDQVGGAAMGSPLARMWATIYYSRYVDIICCFKNCNDACLFFECLYSCHPNIKFTMETEQNRRSVDIFVWLTRSVKPHYGITWFIYLFIYLFVYESRAPVTWSIVYGLRGLMSVVDVVCVYALVVSLGASNFFQVIVYHELVLLAQANRHRPSLG